MDNFNLKKFISEKSLLNESAPGYDTRKSGEALPTLESVKAAYEAKKCKCGKGETCKCNKIQEGIWKLGNPDDIRDFIKKVNTLQKDYWEVVGSDTVMNGLDSAMDEAKILLDVKMGNVQPEEFDLEINEDVSFGGAGTDKRSGQVIGDILQLIKSTGIDPEEVIEAIKMSDNFKNSGLPKMDPDNWAFGRG